MVPGFNEDGETHGIMGTSFSIPQTDVITEQSYCYDRENKNLLVSYKEDGTIKKYVYGNGLISTDERNDSDGSMTFLIYLYDLRGSVTEEMDASGNKKGEYRYSTYGIRTTISGATTEVGYCGRDGVLSDGVGLLYMRARYYNPHINRFINQDIITGDISNSNSLNRYTYVEGNPATMIDPFGLCAEKVDNNSKSVTDYMVSDLYINLMRYGILSEEQICMFLAQCMFETINGTELTEQGSMSYFAGKSYGYEYRGGGYIHLTHEGGYQGFAIYLMLRDYPELKGEKDGHNYKYTSRDHDKDPVVTKRFMDIVAYAGELSINVDKYTRIVDGYENKSPADYVASHYAWESATYFWTISKELNAKVANGADIDEISNKVLGGYSESWADREKNYNKIKDAYELFEFSMAGD